MLASAAAPSWHNPHVVGNLVLHRPCSLYAHFLQPAKHQIVCGVREVTAIGSTACVVYSVLTTLTDVCCLQILCTALTLPLTLGLVMLLCWNVYLLSRNKTTIEYYEVSCLVPIPQRSQSKGSCLHFLKHCTLFVVTIFRLRAERALCAHRAWWCSHAYLYLTVLVVNVASVHHCLLYCIMICRASQQD